MKKAKATHLHYRKNAGEPGVVEACDDQDNVVETMVIRDKDKDWDAVYKRYRALMDRACPLSGIDAREDGE